MLNWLKSCWSALRAWRARNARAHDAAPASPCCSAPPPGAGRHDEPHH